MASWVLHVDLDQFIAAVEVLRHPELEGLPVVVGGRGDPSERGVVATASYAAREYGVRSGMPLRTAARRCPDAVFLAADHEVYEAASAEVMATLRSLDAVVVEVLGWDEAFLGVQTDDPEAFARGVQAAVFERTRLRCSVGIGDNKLRAKTATEFGKPQGVFRLTEATWQQVMGERTTDALWGIGRKTARKLEALGVATVADLAAADARRLADELGPTLGPWYRRLGRGADTSPVVGTPWVPRSHGRETTFQADLADWGEVERETARLAHRVSAEIAAEGRPAVRVEVKVRFAPFDTYTRSMALPEPTIDPERLARSAVELVNRFEPGRAVRLLGVRAEMAPPAPAGPPGPAGPAGPT